MSSQKEKKNNKQKQSNTTASTVPTPHSKLSLGVETPIVSDIVDHIIEITQQQFDFAVVPIFHPRHIRNFPAFHPDDLEEISAHFDVSIHDDLSSQQKAAEAKPLTRSDLLLSTDQWTCYVVGKTSPWLNLESSDFSFRQISRKTLSEELNWATHLNLSAVLLPTLTENVHGLAHLLSNFLINRPHMQIWARIPTVPKSQLWSDQNVTRCCDQSWKVWNKLRLLVESAPNLCVALELTTNLPNPEILSKWLAEPLKVYSF